MNELIEQRTPEWLAARCGKVTASEIWQLLPSAKTGKPTAAYETYLYKKLAERLTGSVTTNFVTAAMQWGIDHEAEAADYYAMLNDAECYSCGIFDHPTIPMASASPDRLVGTDGLLEIKCPSTEKHLRTSLTKEIDEKYIAQMQWQMACTGRAWCDFFSYDPRLPPEFVCTEKRVMRDGDAIANLEALVITFNAKLNEAIDSERINFFRNQKND
jgi:putative phage-type endonuclease